MQCPISDLFLHSLLLLAMIRAASWRFGIRDLRHAAHSNSTRRRRALSWPGLVMVRLPKLSPFHVIHAETYLRSLWGGHQANASISYT